MSDHQAGYGFYGKGTDGYVHYKQAFDETQKGGGRPPRGGDGCLSELLGTLYGGFLVVLFGLYIALFPPVLCFCFVMDDFSDALVGFLLGGVVILVGACAVLYARYSHAETEAECEKWKRYATRFGIFLLADTAVCVLFSLGALLLS